MSIPPKQLSRLGEFYLQEAVLDVLCSAYSEGGGINPVEISRRAGIYRKHGAAGLNDAIVHGILNQLVEQGKVERVDPNVRGAGWRLTDDEYQRRRDDSELG